MRPVRRPVFVARSIYRRRRVADAVRLLPVAGAFMLILPLLWSAGGAMSTVAGMGYLFAVWLALVLAAAILSRPLARDLGSGASPSGSGAASGAGSGAGSGAASGAARRSPPVAPGSEPHGGGG